MLIDAVSGDDDAAQQLLPMVYDELRRLAGAAMRGERPDHTLQATALVNEAFVRLIGSRPLDVNDRVHFFSIAATTIRRILVDHARAHNSQKRGGGHRRRCPMDRISVQSHGEIDVLELEDAMAKLEHVNDRYARIVEMRFFGGMTNREIGTFLDISRKTVDREWAAARAILYRELSDAIVPAQDATDEESTPCPPH